MHLNGVGVSLRRRLGDNLLCSDDVDVTPNSGPLLRHVRWSTPSMLSLAFVLLDRLLDSRASSTSASLANLNLS